MAAPFRFIFQIITIVRLHIAIKNGDDEFGRRGCTSDAFGEYIRYYFFNSGVESGESTRRLAQNYIKNSHKYEEAQSNQYAIEAQEFLNNHRRSDGVYNLHIVPLCDIDSSTQSTFNDTNDYSYGHRYIDTLWVNGHKVVTDSKFSCPILLSLSPGYYDFKIRITGNVMVPSLNNSEKTVYETMSLKNVYIGNEHIHLCVYLQYASVFTEYKNASTGRIIRKEFTRFNEHHEFFKLSQEAVNDYSAFWHSTSKNIDKVQNRQVMGL